MIVFLNLHTVTLHIEYGLGIKLYCILAQVCTKNKKPHDKILIDIASVPDLVRIRIR